MKWNNVKLVFQREMRDQLRDRRTLTMLDRFAADGWITGTARDELAEAYRFLRRVEHVIQMIGDEQTHTLPATHDALAPVAALLGCSDRRQSGLHR